MIVLYLSAAFSILNVIDASYDRNGKGMSKEDTNDNQLNNLNWLGTDLTNLQHLLKCRQNQQSLGHGKFSAIRYEERKGLSLKELQEQ